MGPAHLGIGLAAKPLEPDLPLWTLLVGSEVLDLLSFGFEALGLEKFAVSETSFQNGVEVLVPGSVPWSHGLFMSLVWSLLAAALVYLVKRNRRAAGVLGLVVFSHWILDFIVHEPDLPLFFENSPKIGLGLWTSGPGLIFSIILEVLFFSGGLAVYLLYRRRDTKTVPAAEINS